VSPEEEPELRGIERAIGRKLPRIIVPDFDYAARPEAKLEIPLAERIAQIRAKKAEDRERSKAKAARREANGQASSARPGSRADGPGSGARQRGPGRGGPGSGGRPGSSGRPGGSGGAGGRPAARGGR
jgi:ATP-dependent RNA helicase RhlE